MLASENGQSAERGQPPFHLPALRCYMGDWIYYVTAMRLSEAAELISNVEEVHKSKKLCEWIQRRLEEDHAKSIADYLINEPSRFFGSIVVGVYGGEPRWSYLRVGDPQDQLNGSDEDRLNRTVGILSLTGGEHLIPIDGQHRVAGIKKAVETRPSLRDEEVTVIVVGHSRSVDGRVRTRRLFVTLNKRARRVSQKDIVALDEDNGLAIVARRMVDDFKLFMEGEVISFGKTVNIHKKDEKSITSVLGVHQIVSALYPRDREGWPSKIKVMARRPDDNILDEMFAENTKYWNLLCRHVQEYRLTLRERKKLPGDFRTSVCNHLLFRPSGQQAFAGAVGCLVGRGYSMERAVKLLVKSAELSLLDPVWRNILWDPVGKKMLKEVSAAEAFLLESAGEGAKTDRSKARLARIRKAREEEDG